MVFSDKTLIHHFIEQSAQDFPDKIALIHEKLRITYKSINDQANQLASHFINLGVQKGDRVVFILHNGLEYIVSYYGALKAGAVPVSLNTEIKPDSLSPLLNEIDSRILISSSRFEDMLIETNPAQFGIQKIIIKNPKLDYSSTSYDIISWDDLVQDKECPNPGVAINEYDLANIIYTSGSVGTPKGVMLTHSNVASNVNSICTYLSLTEKDIQMIVLPLFYVMGKSLLNTHFAVGGTVVINNKFAFTASVVKQMIEENVTGFSGVPSTYAYLLHRSPLEKSRDKLLSLRYCSQAGGHMSNRIKKELRRVLPAHTDIFIMYGATEASARLTFLAPHHFEEKIDSIGKAIPGVTMKVLDETGKEVSVNEVGELVGSGPNIMQGYWKDPETSAKVLNRNGYYTGDLGFRDNDGYFFLSGRKDNMLKVGGHRINPQEVEDALMDTELVLETAVLGISDELLGTKLIAVVSPLNKECTESDILNSCAAKLAKYKLPEKIEFVKALPKNASGKINRQKCRELLEE